MNILRAGLILFYILSISLITLGISSLYSYLNTGADRSTMFHTQELQERFYIPTIEWDTTAVKGRKIDANTINAIEVDYLNAWQLKATCLRTNSINGIEDYYTRNAAVKFKKLINYNLKNNTTIDMTSLEHHPKVTFFSEDGKMVVFKDVRVREHKQIYKNDLFINKSTTYNTYKVIMLLEDGYWRIRQIVKKSTTHGLKEMPEVALNFDIKGINYYPKNSPWATFSDSFNKDTIAADFKIIKDAGLNSIRMFVGYEDFGKAQISKEKTEKLITFLDLAESADLKVLVTLFDFYGNYAINDWTITQQHATAVVNAIKHHNAVLGWDLKNEPDLDYNSRGKEVVQSWLEQMNYHIKSIDSLHPITVGWSNTQSAGALSDQLDFISFHYYEPLEELDGYLSTLKKEINGKELVVTEYGVSSYSGIWNINRTSVEKQKDYHKEAQDLLTKNKLPFMSWTLYDFESVPEDVIGTHPWLREPQKYYGFLDSKGKQKPSFKFIAKPLSEN